MRPSGLNMFLFAEASARSTRLVGSLVFLTSFKMLRISPSDANLLNPGVRWVGVPNQQMTQIIRNSCHYFVLVFYMWLQG